MQGWVKLHRKILESSVFDEPGILKLWIYCLMKAAHKKRQILVGQTVVDLEPGQFVTGRNALSDDYNKGMKPKNKVNEVTLWRWLSLLEKMGNLHIKKTNKFSVVTVDKWEFYQGDESENVPQVAHQMHNKCTTNAQQMHTNKNVKNDKNDKNKTIRRKFEISDKESAELLFELIKQNNPGAKEPNVEKWADDIRKIRELDKRTPEQINWLIKWTQQNDFWSANILSPAKLRKQWDQLVIKAKKEHEQKQQLKIGAHKKDNVVDWETLRGELKNG